MSSPPTVNALLANFTVTPTPLKLPSSDITIPYHKSSTSSVSNVPSSRLEVNITYSCESAVAYSLPLTVILEPGVNCITAPELMLNRIPSAIINSPSIINGPSSLFQSVSSVMYVVLDNELFTLNTLNKLFMVFVLDFADADLSTAPSAGVFSAVSSDTSSNIFSATSSDTFPDIFADIFPDTSSVTILCVKVCTINPFPTDASTDNGSLKSEKLL